MNEIVEEWIGKAEADFATAEREFEVREKVNYEAVCFHAQQCVEKLMKGVLISHGVAPPKVHDLAHLSRLLVPVVADWEWPLQELHFLSRAAVEFRYPGESADREDAYRALDICRRIRTQLKKLMSSR